MVAREVFKVLLVNLRHQLLHKLCSLVSNTYHKRTLLCQNASPGNHNGGTCFIFQTVFFSITIDESVKDPCICEQTCLLFSGAVLGCHVYLITDGSIVTSSITLYQYIRFVIITRWKPYLSIYEVKLLRVSANLQDSSDYKTL